MSKVLVLLFISVFLGKGIYFIPGKFIKPNPFFSSLEVYRNWLEWGKKGEIVGGKLPKIDWFCDCFIDTNYIFSS